MRIPALFLSFIAHQQGLTPLLVKYPSKPTWKPKFTDEELAEVRALSKRERELKVAELRAKYLAEFESQTNKETL